MNLLREVDNELKRDTSSENRISNSDVNAVSNEVAHGLLEILLSGSKTDFTLKDEIAEGITCTDGHRGIGELETAVSLNAINELLESLIGVDINVEGDRGADGALRIDLILESVSVDTSTARISHIVLQVDSVGGDLESFINANGRDDSISSSDGRDDALDDTLCELESDSIDAELFGSLLGAFVNPSHVNGVVLVEGNSLPLLILVLLPFMQDVRNTVLRLTRSVRQSTHLEIQRIGGIQGQRALQARSHARKHHTSLSLQTFSSSINKGNHSVHVNCAIIIEAHQRSQHRVDPTTSLNRIQACNNHVELLVELTRLSSNVRIMTRRRENGNVMGKQDKRKQGVR